MLHLESCSSQWHRNLSVVKGAECPGGHFAMGMEEMLLLGEVSLPTCLL